MTGVEQALLVILSTALAIFLIIGIFALIKLNQILADIKQITAKAEKIADQAEAIGEFFQKTAGPAAIVKLISNVIHNVTNKTSKGKKDE